MKIHTTRNTVAAAAVFFALSGISTLGNANLPQVNIAWERVSYADLDLNNEAGQNTLYQRLKAAAESVCESTDVQTRFQFEQHKCTEEALNRAVQEVGHQELTEIHQS